MLRSATVLTTFVLLSSVAMAADEPVWHTDLAKAKSIARETKRPLMLVFR